MNYTQIPEGVVLWVKLGFPHKDLPSERPLILSCETKGLNQEKTLDMRSILDELRDFRHSTENLEVKPLPLNRVFQIFPLPIP